MLLSSALLVGATPIVYAKNLFTHMLKVQHRVVSSVIEGDSYCSFLKSFLLCSYDKVKLLMY